MNKETSLWKDFPKTLSEFERKFSTESACRAYLVAVRWGGKPRCGRCDHKRVYGLSRDLWECAACGYQTSVTAGTPLEGTRKDLRLWFRAMWEVVSRKNGISAKDLQRVMGFGSYKTAWSWLHKIRRCLVSPQAEPLGGTVQLDEGYVGGRRKGNQRGLSPDDKAVVFIAAEVADGRVRLEHAPNAKNESAASFVQRHIAADATIMTDGGGVYNKKTLHQRTHEACVQTPSERAENDAVQVCHWTIANLKRWWIGTHHGAMRDKYLQNYLDEFTFRHNRRKTKGVGRLVARVIENLVTVGAMTMRQIIDKTKPCPRFAEGVT
jgi:transposase-like protein